MNYKDFSSKIKSKYPDYSDMDDRELAQKMVAKYPQYSDVTFEEELAAQPVQPQQPPGGIWDRMKQRSESIYAPTATAEAVGLKPGIAADIVGAPERTARAAAGAFGSLADIAGTGIGMAGKAVNKLSGGRLGELGKKVITTASPALEPIGKIGQMYGKYKESLPESGQANLTGAEGAASGIGLFGGVKAAPSIARGAVKAPAEILGGTGKAIENTGKNILKGELKIEKPLAKKYGKNIAEAKQKAVDIVSKYDLESAGNFDKMAEKAKNVFVEKVTKADDLIAEFELKNPSVTTDVDNIFNELKNNWVNGNVRPGERQSARNTIAAIQDEIMGDALEKGTSLKSVSPMQLVSIKRSIGAKYKNFDRSLEPLKESVYDATESAIIKKINTLVPEAGKLNLEARDLKYVQNAAEQASARIANQNKGFMGGIADIGIGSAGAVGVYSHPEQAVPIIAATLATMGAKRALGQGRGAGALIRTGKGLQTIAGKKPVRTPKEIFGN